MTLKTLNFQNNEINSTSETIKIERNLYYKVIEFIKKNYPSAIFIAGLDKHQAETPDILIINHNKDFNGFAIELKSPIVKGKDCYNQNLCLSNLKTINYKCLSSNKYDEIISELIEYFQEIRIKCNLCQRWFKTSESLAQHLISFHNVSNIKT